MCFSVGDRFLLLRDTTDKIGLTIPAGCVGEIVDISNIPHKVKIAYKHFIVHQIYLYENEMMKV